MFLRRWHEDAVAGVAIHGLEGGGRGGGSRIAIGVLRAYGEVIDVGEGDGGDFSSESAGDLGAKGQGAEGGVFLMVAEVFGFAGRD